MKFWNYLETLVAENEINIDRPKGTRHPRVESIEYPLDYGFLENTASNDRDGIDIWVGSKINPKVEGIIATVDLLKKDSEIKILYG